MSQGSSFSLTIMSDTRYLAPLRSWVKAVAAIVGPLRFPDRAIFPCTLALIEAVDNAIFHAHQRRRGLPIVVRLETTPRSIVVEVLDQGSGIQNEPVLAPEMLDVHGRGLFLIRQLMASVESHHTKRGNSLRMSFSL